MTKIPNISKAELEKKSVKQLREHVKQYNLSVKIKGASKMRKGDLVNALHSHIQKQHGGSASTQAPMQIKYKGGDKGKKAAITMISSVPSKAPGMHSKAAGKSKGQQHMDDFVDDLEQRVKSGEYVDQHKKTRSKAIPKSKKAGSKIHNDLEAFKVRRSGRGALKVPATLIKKPVSDAAKSKALSELKAKRAKAKPKKKLRPRGKKELAYLNEY